jgi:hypothetical protein
LTTDEENELRELKNWTYGKSSPILPLVKRIGD